MVVFADLTLIKTPDNRGRYNYHCTTADKIMNNLSGGILILYMVVGTVICIHLISYYRKHMRSWLDRFLFFSSIVRLPCIITNCLYVSYQLLNDKSPTQILEVENWGIAVTILSYITDYFVMAFDVAIVATQYCNIHRPERTLANSRSVCWRESC